MTVRILTHTCTCGLLLAAAGCQRHRHTPHAASPDVAASSPAPGATAAPPATSMTPLRSVGESDVSAELPLQMTGRIINSNDGAYAVKYLFDPSPPPMNAPFSITVYVGARDNSGIEGLSLSVDAAMPEHGHGMNVEPIITPMPGHAFTVDNMLFHMSGRWEVYFDITREGVTSRAQDEVTLE